ncbi:MAG: uracil-DNA glycosylase [Polyangiales bacterium]
MTTLDDSREELRALVGGARALLEQLKESGATELPATDPLLRKLSNAAPIEGPRQVAAAPLRESRSQTSSDAAARAKLPIVPSPPARTLHPQRTSGGPTSGEQTSRASNERADPGLRLSQIGEVVAGCTRCALHETRTQTVFARGSALAELMFVGEGPGAEEDAQGLPFVGKAGQLLDKMIEAMGLSPPNVYVANIVKCRPPGNRKPEPVEMETCEGYLHEQIALVQPKVIVALGATAVEGLLKVSGITKLRGSWRLYRGAIPVMPTFHPAYLLRNPPAKREVWADLQEVMKRLGIHRP